MKNIKHIFFDLDNTLWDFRRNSKCALVELYKIHDMESKYGYSFEDFYPHYHISNETLWADLRDKKVTKEELRHRRFKEAFQNTGIENETLAHLFEKEYMEQVTNFNYVVDGAEELLIKLQEKYPIHIITNGFDEVSKRKINNSVIKKYVTTLTSSDEYGALKPEPGIFHYALEKAGAKAEESLYVGDDWKADVEGSKRAGMSAIFFNPLNENHLWIDDVPVISQIGQVLDFIA